jgi:IS605 OrfB family transposase
LNKRWFKFTASKRNNPVFSITYSPKKKLLIPVAMDRQFQRFKSFLNDGWLFDTVSLLKDGRISVAFEKGFPHPEINQKYVLGVDIGSSTLAAVSIFDIKTSRIVKQLYFGRDVAERQRKYLERKAKLQSLADNGSGKAKKSLRKLKHKQFNFVKTRSGQVAKEIINLAKRYDASISIEKFKNIRVKRGRFRKDANRKINRIPYGKFKEFLFSNAEMLGIPLKEVDAYHTSKWCSACGAVNNGHYSGNYALYKCKVCGKIVNSDRKASLAIAVKSLLERENHELTIPDFAQISNRRVPVNGLMRPDAVGLPNVAVQHANQPMESHPIY